jgi:hypothetical protein
MTGRWWRAYDEAVDDPKLGGLSDKLHRAWFNLMCVASANGGVLPSIDAIAFKLRTSIDKAAAWIRALIEAGLIDETDAGLVPHNWSSRQFTSDKDPTSNARQRRKRERDKERDVTVDVTRDITDMSRAPETDSETEAERKKEEDAPKGATIYAFESGVIKLNERDLTRWKAAFSHLDVPAELVGLTKWAGDQRDWFFAVSGALAKRNRDVAMKKNATEKPSDFKWNGIEGVL